MADPGDVADRILARERRQSHIHLALGLLAEREQHLALVVVVPPPGMVERVGAGGTAAAARGAVG